MTFLDGRAALVIGAARSGRAAARLLAARGARVHVVDRSPAAAPDPDWPPQIRLTAGTDRDVALDGIDLVVPSPGVPRDHPLLVVAERRGCTVWSEIELAARCLTCPILAVTGTNGKSTTTVLLGAMLAADGRRTFVGGNLGTPLSEAPLATPPWEVAVAEVSSFQLEWVDAFRPQVGALLNLTPDHQDRYADLAAYGAAKARLFARQEARDVAVLNRDDAWAWGLRAHLRATVWSFGRTAVAGGTYLDGDEVVVPVSSGDERFALADSPLRGTHNRENIQAALTAAAAFGVSAAAMRAALRQTAGLPHRLEWVRDCRGVAYYDDSKGTNTGAVEKSLLGFAGGVVLLLGGYDKGGDFHVLAPLIRERVAHAICFGAAGPHIAAQLDGTTHCVVTPSLAAAVRAAAALAAPGQTVLLSPGCASFDEFRDYVERGRRFRALVEQL
jgi:UDP-N-acetylmuramoylalanine--D-glutamate ligase